jgi:hypothetical protein
LYVQKPDASKPTLPKPDAFLSKPDMPKPVAPKPDASLPKPDMQQPIVSKPDASLPKPDISKPDMPKQVITKPDAALPKPDIAMAKPDTTLPKPDMSTPASWRVEKFPELPSTSCFLPKVCPNCAVLTECAASASLNTTGALLDIFGRSSDDVWAVGWAVTATVTGPQPVFYEFHWDGTKWTSSVLPGVTSTDGRIWVSPTGDRFVGVNGAIFINGYKMSLPYNNNVTTSGLSCGNDPWHWGGIDGIWGTSSADVFFTTDQGIVLHYDGTGILAMSMPSLVQDSISTHTVKYGCPPGYFLKGIWGTDHNNVYAVGGGPWHTVEPALLPCTEFSNCPYFNAEVSLILHFDGKSWQKVSRTWPLIVPDGRLVSVWGADKNTIFATGGIGGKGIILSNKGGMVWQSLNSGLALNFDSIGGNSAAVWFVGRNESYGGLATYDPKLNLWDSLSVPGSAPLASAVWISGENIFLAGWSKEVVSSIPYIEKWTPAVIYYR